jgi:hypothetical protein
MRGILYLSFLALVACVAPQQTTPKPAVNGRLMSSKDLGHGFSVGTYQQSIQGGFESVGYFSHCVFKSQDLGQCESLFPSPSGKFAVYQDATTGFVMFFNASSGKNTQVTSSYQGPLDSATWQEEKARVDFIIGELLNAGQFRLHGNVHPLYFLYTSALGDGT